MEKLKITYFDDREPEAVAVSSTTSAIADQPDDQHFVRLDNSNKGDGQHFVRLDNSNEGDDQHFVRLDNSDASDTSIYDKLSEPRFNPESAKIAAEAAIGTLDDNVDITDPDYDEAETQAIEDELASGHYRT